MLDGLDWRIMWSCLVVGEFGRGTNLFDPLKIYTPNVFGVGCNFSSSTRLRRPDLFIGVVF